MHVFKHCSDVFLGYFKKFYGILETEKCEITNIYTYQNYLRKYTCYVKNIDWNPLKHILF